jgi:hypothetical protein
MTNTFRAAQQVTSLRIFLALLFLCAPPMMIGAQTNVVATSSIEVAHDHLRGGSDLVFKMKLNEPLPEGARFDVRLSPVDADQEITVSSGEPENKERTEFVLKTKLPEKAISGEWHIKIVYLFLPGTSWTNNTLATNPDFRFTVEGPKLEIPTKATATLVSDHR